ncbi:cadherin-like domain-containing protein, partial [Rhodopirellula europaea]|uniref:cadherin-like domain-containing protein n=1 Tax=Rhodopirellula europaea TaxID=1263866 RepID=UPI0005879ACF
MNDAPVAADLDLATNFDDPIPATLPGDLELKIVNVYSAMPAPGDEILVSELGFDVDSTLTPASFDFGFSNPTAPRATVTIGGVPVNPDVLLSDLGITYVGNSVEGILTINPTGSSVMQGLAAGEIAIVNVKFDVFDDESLNETGNIKFKVIGVNEAPTLGLDGSNQPIGIDDQTATEDSAFSLAVAGDVFVDVDGDPLTLTATGLPGWLSFDGTTFTGTPGNDDVTSTPATITVTATDPSGEIVSTMFDITVVNTNDAPEVSGPVDLGSIPEDSAGRTITAAQLLANASDIDLPAQTLSVSSLTLDTAGAGVLLGTGPWTFVPNPNFNGEVSFSYDVTDSATPTAGVVSATATLVITPASDSDNIDPNGEIDPSGLTGGAPGGNLLIGTGIPGDGLVIATDAVDAPGLEIALRADMRFVGPAPAPRDPSDPTRFIVGAGEAGNGPNSNGTSGDFDDNWARWNVIVAINTATDGGSQKIGDSRFSLSVRNETTGEVLGESTLQQLLLASIGPDFTPTDFANTNAGSIYQGSLNFEGLFPTDFDPSDSAVYSISITAEDPQTGSPLVASRIELQTNTAPVAVNDSAAGTEDTPVTFAASEMLGNDTDPDGNMLSIKSVADGSNGSVVLNGDGSVTFTPDANFNGVADFTYVATDGLTFEGDSDPATVM